MLILELHVNFNFAMPAVSARGALLVSSPRKTYEVQHLSERGLMKAQARP